MTTGRPDTATILFTDLVGSTSRRTSLGEELADSLQSVHDRLLGECVEEHGGRVVKSLGDGIMAVFGSASEAVTAAVSIQVATARYSASPRAIAELKLRIGLSTGDVSWDDNGDCFGTAVIEAARLEAAAEPGQILCSALTRMITRGRGGHDFADVGDLDLKGLAESLPTCEVNWSFEPPTTALALPLPGPLDVTREGIFVGRADEVRALGSLGGSGDRLSFVCLLGEPGIGKTRLAAEVASKRHAFGATALFGRCEEDLPVPFRPFVEALTFYVRHLPADELAGRLGPDPAQLGLLCPDIWSLVPGIERPQSAIAELEQFRLFEAVRGWLADNQLLLVIDDVHWATRPTFQLLRHLMRSQESSPTSIIATARSTELPEELRSVLDDSALNDAASVVELSGLGSDDIGRLAASRQGVELTGDELRQRSGGNPFFVRALLEDAVGGGSETAQAAVRRRIERVPERTQACLTTGALLGLQFELPTLAAVNDMPVAEALDDVELGAVAGLVREVAPNTFRFAHALVREAILMQLSDTRRLQLHEAVGRTLEGLTSAEQSEIAYHYTRAAVDATSRRRAADWHRNAAERAESVAAFADAAEHLRQAAGLLVDDVLLALGLEIEAFRVEREVGAYEEGTIARLSEICDHARSIGSVDIEALALGEVYETQAVLGVHDAWWVDRLVSIDVDRIEDERVKAATMARAPNALFYSGRELPDTVEHSIEAAIRQAEAVGDANTLATAYMGQALHLAAVDPSNVGEVIHTMEKAQRAALDGGSVRDAAHYSFLLSARQIELGDLEGARRSGELIRRYAEFGHNPFPRLLHSGTQCVLAFIEGRLADSERLSHEADEAGEAVHGLDASGGHGQQMFAIRREQDRLGEVRPMIEMSIKRGVSLSTMWRPGAAALFADLGMVEEAARQLEFLVTPEGVTIPSDSRFTTSLSFITDACVATEDVLRAAVARDAFTPYSGLVVVVLGITCFGPVDRYLARLAGVLGQTEAALELLEQALALATQMGSPLFEAQALVDQAVVHAHIGDEARAVESASAALDAIGTLELGRVRRMAVALLRDTSS